LRLVASQEGLSSVELVSQLVDLITYKQDCSSFSKYTVDSIDISEYTVVESLEYE
jgi:hypothetical protein